MSSSKRFLRLSASLLVLATLVVLGDHAAFWLANALERKAYQDPQFHTSLQLLLRRGEPDVLILGTSRTYEGIQAPLFRQTWGLRTLKEASFGKGPRYHQLFYQAYRRQAPPPGLVVYGVDYFLYAIQSNRRWLGRLEPNVWGEIPDWGHPLWLLDQRQRIQEFWTNGVALLNLWGRREGYQGEPLGLSRLQYYRGAPGSGLKGSRERPRNVFPVLFPQPPGREGECFHQLLDQWCREGVPVALVILPDCRGTYETNTQKSLLVSNLQDLIAGKENVWLLNGNRPEVFPIDDPTLFLDGGYNNPNSHLNARGARVFWNTFLGPELDAILRKPGMPLHKSRRRARWRH